MMDAVKDYLAPKRFGVVAYVCLIVHFIGGLILIPVTSALRAGEIGKFSCAVGVKSTASYKTYVEKTCYSRYEQTYNSPLPLYGFVVLSIGLTVLVSVIYSLAVSSRLDEIADRISNGSQEATSTNGEATSNGFCVFVFYLFHLVARSLFGIVFSVLQHTRFFPSGFDFEFSCSLPAREVATQLAKNSSVALSNITSITCENSTAPEKDFWGIIVSVLNTGFSLIILGEVIYLWQRFPMLSCRCEVNWGRGIEFVTIYLLRKRYTPVAGSVAFELTNIDCIKFYQKQVLQQPLSPDINYASKTSLDDMYVDVVIHTGRAQHQFSKEMRRHEIYDVYRTVPWGSIRLEEIKDLFYPDEDTKNKFPRTILAVGRPGIGKTALTEKIVRDWALENRIDEFYHGKTAFFLKFRWFNFEELKDTSLKRFVRHGTGGLDEEKFEIIFEQILMQPEKAIFIFDGLDEFTGDVMKCLDEAQILPNDLNICICPMTLFIKLVSGKMLPGATILVTSRPTANDFNSKLYNYFDRTVEIIGFTSEKIEDYVDKFCKNIDQIDLKPTIWNHIKSSHDLLNLCYIPVNSYIVCVTLSGCLTSSDNNSSALPTTLTAFYQTALYYFAKYHDRNVHDTCSEEMLEKLQEKAFDGMENAQLVFNENEFDEKMRKSSLVNSFTNPVCPLQTQFCFIHLTIQEYLAARHVVATLQPDEIETLVSTHIENVKWHLVLQFISGLLGEKVMMPGSDYLKCVLAYGKSLTLRGGVIELDDYRHVFVMKCLREVDDEEIVKKVCERTELNTAHTLQLSRGHRLISTLSSDWATVAFVYKHMNSLIHLDLYLSGLTPKDIYHLEVCEFLQRRCLETLHLRISIYRGIDAIVRERVLWALANSKCTLNHVHVKLRQLKINGFGTSIASLSNICRLINDGRARHLQLLDLQRNDITSCGITELCNVLNDELCGELTHLDLSQNSIGNEDVGMLCNALIRRQCEINTLVLSLCSLTTNCVLLLSEVLCNEHCKLTYLSLSVNAIGDQGVRLLCADALRKEQCKLARLNLENCSLTPKCMRWLSEALCDKHCKLADLSLGLNPIGDEGVRMLCTDALGKEQCKLTRLNLESCSLTAKCMHALSEILCNKHCKLTDLSLYGNDITDDGVRMLCTNALGKEECSLINLSLEQCNLTDQCVRLLCDTLQEKNCRLVLLSIRSAYFTEYGRNLLRDIQEVAVCKDRGLKINIHIQF